MSNRIDFFQSEHSKLALPAATVSVEIDGELCPVLETVEIVRDLRPNFSWARLSYNSAPYTDDGSTVRCPVEIAAEEIEAEFVMGQSVCIRQCYNGVAPGAATFSFPIFCGRIEDVETTLGSEGETVEIVAKDFSAQLSRTTVYGQRVAVDGDSTVFLSGLDTIFNPDGGANATAAPIQVSGKSYVAFCAGPSNGRCWKYAEAIDYLLSEYLPGERLQNTGHQAIGRTDRKPGCPGPRCYGIESLRSTSPVLRKD